MATAPLPKPTPLGALRLPRIARNRGSLDLPYLDMTFECTARFYGLAPPLRTGLFRLHFTPMGRSASSSFVIVARDCVRVTQHCTYNLQGVAPRYESSDGMHLAYTTHLSQSVCLDRSVTGAPADQPITGNSMRSLL